MKFLVLGGGAQGSACAFDLVRRDGVESVVLADLDVNEPHDFLKPFLDGALELVALDAKDESAVRDVLEGVDAVACALPYHFNFDMTRLAIEAGAHFCDLGGHTEDVDRQKELSDQAREAGVSAVPDSGVAPGMVNILAQGGIDAMDETDSVRILVGGLPQHPEPPLNYQIVYSMEGVLDYYTMPVLVLEGHAVVEKEALTEIESVRFDGLGELEAFLTAGGVSRMPYRYEGRIRHMTYKTLRYPGHAALMKSMRDLGLMSLEPVEVDGTSVVPRDVFIEVLTPKLLTAAGEDLVAMRVVVTGVRGDEPHTVTYEMVDYYDAENGVTAMMRTTGYSLATTAYLQATGAIPPGVRTPSECVPVDVYVDQLAARGIVIERTER